ncbi:SLAM family member 8 [Corvus kubaryi]|uniref:SLAM family member 8 n=1 Tax=Corvus kubaryi TaxID=68294 RepID=UPI001C0450F6|nr:SLAM family member 8 [Corvus kubaryi]
MAPGPVLNLLFLLLLRAAGLAWPQEAQRSEVTGAVGGVAFLNSHTSLNPSKYSQIHWRWKNQVKIAIQRRGEKAEYPQSLLKERLELFENYTLKISHLRVGDSSEYRLYLEDDSGKENVERILLKVYDLVPKPKVSAVTNGDSQRCDAILNCSVALQEVTYEWIPPQKLPMKGDPVLRVSFDPKVETYVCKVSNPVSSNNASLTYRHPCSWTGESSSVTSCPTPGALVALGHLILLFLLLAMA